MKRKIFKELIARTAKFLDGIAKPLFFWKYDKPFGSAGFSMLQRWSMLWCILKEKICKRINNVSAFQFVLSAFMWCNDIRIMKEMRGVDALELAKEISKLPDGKFNIAFFPYNSTKSVAKAELRVIKECKVRTQLPEDQFSRDSENFFLFSDKDGNPKTCYRILIRFIAFSSDKYQMRKVNWT